MTNVIQQLKQNRIKGQFQPLQRGNTPNVSSPDVSDEWVGFGVFLTSSIGIFFLSWFLLAWIKIPHSLDLAANTGFISGLLIALLYYLSPILKILGITIWKRKRPDRQILRQFSSGQKFVCLGLIAFGLFYSFNHWFPYLIYYIRHHRFPDHWCHLNPYVTTWWHMVVIWFLIVFLLIYVAPLVLPKEEKENHSLFPNKKSEKFGLWLGYSTGHLANLWHVAGLAPNLDVVLDIEDAAQNILVLGGIGSGKTTRIMQPLLAQLIEQSVGGMLFDVKGDVKKSATIIAKIVNKQIITIGPGHSRMNLLGGLTPEVAASFLKSAFLLGSGLKVDGFWVNTASELCRNTLGLLSFLPTHYTLQGLYGYLFDDEVRESIQKQLKELAATLEPTKKRLLKTYTNYHNIIFDNFDEKVKSGVNATIAQALSPFNHPDLIDAFCDTSQTTLKMENILDGDVYLVDMPLSTWGLGGKVAYTFIKLRFFNLMQSRNQRQDWNQENPVFFMCDEYQEIVSANKDGLSDLNFWDKSRSSKTIGIISAQSVSSFYAALGDRDLSHALLQNFRQKLCFRIEDTATLKMMDYLAGRAMVMRKTISKTNGKSSSGWADESSHSSSTESISETRENVLDPILFRNLSPNHAVALLSIKGQSMDDVLKLLPLFLNDETA